MAIIRLFNESTRVLLQLNGAGIWCDPVVHHHKNVRRALIGLLFNMDLYLGCWHVRQ